MNTFATLLLAYPFYLAIKGRLTNYIALAKPDASSTQGANAQTSTAAPGNSSASSSDLSNVVSIFKNVGEAATLLS